MARQNGPYRIKMEAKRNIDLVNRYVAEQKPQREIMSTEIQTKLIRYWIQHPTLYDRSRSDYKKLHKRNESINLIAECMGLDPFLVKKRIFAIRKRFIKEIKKKTDTGNESDWPFFQACSFLVPQLRLHGAYSEVGSMGDVADTNDFDEPEATGQNQQNIQGEYDFIVKEEFICGGPPYEQSVYKAPDQPIDAAFQFGQYVAQKIRESSNGNSLTLDIMRVILENEQDNGHQTESH